MRFGSYSSTFVAALAVIGCESSTDGGDGQNPVVGAYNAASDMGTITFLREEEVWSGLDYGTATSFTTVDPDQYDFNFDALLPGDDTTACAGDEDSDDVKDEDECTRLISVSVNALQDHEYTIALFGQFDSLEVLVFDKLYHEFDTQDEDEDGDPEDENTEIQFFHLSPGLGEIDVYLEPPGTNLSPVQSRGTLSSKDTFDTLIDEGEYVLSLTAVGDPSIAYFTSNSFTLDRQTRVAFAIRDGAGVGTSEIVVSQFGDRGATFLDRNVSTELRAAHVGPFIGNIDVFANEDFSMPFFSDLGFQQTSAYREVDSSDLIDLAVDVTPVGDPGVFLTREEIDLVDGERATFFLLETSNAFDGLKSRDDFRRLATHAQLRLVNGSSSTLDFYVVEEGSNVSTLSPTSSLSFRSSSGLQIYDPGMYDIVLVGSNTNTTSFGPYTVELSVGGIYTVVAVDTGEATAADIVLLDDFLN